MMRLILVAALAFPAVPASAQDPTEAVQFFYNDPGSELSTENRGRFVGKAKEVLDASDKESEDGPCIDFMLSVDGQDFDEEELKDSLNLAGAMAGDYGSVDATFKQFGEDTKIVWTLEKAGDEWKISDIESPKNGWKLTGIDCTAIPSQ
jgi:hypothetical protein